MFNPSRPNHQTARRAGFDRRRAALAGVLITMLGLALYVSPVAERAARAGDKKESSSAPAASSPNPQTMCPVSTSKATVGEFSPVIHLPTVPVHLNVLPDGRILFWGRDRGINPSELVKDVAGRSEAYVWNMAHGSNKTDVAIWRPYEGNWFIINSSTGASRITQWGQSGDVPVPGDYDGDGRADLAVYRPSAGSWHIINSLNGVAQAFGWGIAGDVAAPGDYDGDGKTDIAVFRPSAGGWHIRRSSDLQTTTLTLGASGDIPVPKDYDLDRKADAAVFRPSSGTWLIQRSSTNAVITTTLGVSGDVPVPGDYNGDGRADAAIWRPSNGTWSIVHSAPIGAPALAPRSFAWGLSGDTATPGDFDGDNKADAAIFRPSEGNWYILNSSNGQSQIKTWGLNGDVMVPADYDGMQRVANTTTNMFCSGHSLMNDGRLFVTGGHKSPDFDLSGEPHTNIFDPVSNRWTRGPDMNQGRWYPYNVTLNTGEPLVLGGDYWANDPTTPATFAQNLVPQIYTLGGSLRSLTPPSSTITLYPYIHMAPDGKVMQAQSGFADRLNSADLRQESRVLDTDANNGLGQWSDLATMLYPHALGTSVLFDSGRKALVVGGFDSLFNPTVKAEFYNLKGAPHLTSWKEVPPMNYPRAYHTGTVLPNGKVLVTGGTGCKGGNHVQATGCADGRNLTAEMWDATASSDPTQIPWCKMAQQNEVRAYHSVAALLPDGRVLVGGGGLPGAIGETDANGQKIVRGNEPFAKLFGHKNVELYSPPYLFQGDTHVDQIAGARPTITSAPASVAYGQTFSVGVANAGSGSKVSLVRYASVTHGFIQDQRQVFLNATPSGTSSLSVSSPADANKVPPGYYMLFVLNSAGVPSVAQKIRVVNTAVYEGYVDGINCGQVYGWAWNRAAPNRAINVSVYNGTTLLGTVSANVFRQDLLNADKGNGYHAFAFNLPASLINGPTHSISVRFSGTSTNLFGSPQPLACRSLFPAPSGTIDSGSGAGQTWEQGIQFSSSVSGKITHLRYWKASGETGPHVGRIWSESGVQLAQVPFLNETASGWQTQVLQTPLDITAGVRYRVSYNVNQFGAKIAGGLSSPISNGPLTAWAAMYSTPSGTFPNTGSVGNFLADIVFSSSQ